MENVSPGGSFSQRIRNCGLPSSDLKYTSGPAASMASASCTTLRAKTTASSAALAAAWLLLLLPPTVSPAPAAAVSRASNQTVNRPAGLATQSQAIYGASAGKYAEAASASPVAAAASCDGRPEAASICCTVRLARLISADTRPAAAAVLCSAACDARIAGAACSSSRAGISMESGGSIGMRRQQSMRAV
jgi:hypothetical protein